MQRGQHSTSLASTIVRPEPASALHREPHNKELELPDDCELWPGHLGGSLCGGPGMDMKVASTIGYERRHQELLAIEDQDEFVTRTTASLRPQPPNFENIVGLNQGPCATKLPSRPGISGFASHASFEPNPARGAVRHTEPGCVTHRTATRSGHRRPAHRLAGAEPADQKRRGHIPGSVH